jgi:alkanesulfonate monooxygenase SsuD/methylene tetrahydromethanopterin reductase-like flavin-dependent oxidoreductase (luciferase family)
MAAMPTSRPVVLAKQLARLDVVTGGRLTFGMGVGYLQPELEAVGVPMERRGARAAEYLGVMRALWEHERPSFDGEFVSFSGVNAHPRPLQRPLPVVMGGYSPAVHRRAARDAQGWYGSSSIPMLQPSRSRAFGWPSPMPVATRPSSRSACRRAEGSTPTSSPRTVGWGWIASS